MNNDNPGLPENENKNVTNTNTDTQPIRLEKTPKKSNKSTLIAIIASISIITIIAIVVALVAFLMPSKEQAVKNALQKLPESSNATLSIDTKNNYSGEKSVLKINIKDVTLSGKSKTSIDSLADDIDLNIYGKNEDIYLSGKDFATAVNLGMESSLKESASQGEVDQIIEGLQYDYENGWIKLDVGGSADQYTANELVAALKDSFNDLSDTSEVKINESKTVGSDTIYDATIDGEKISLTINSKGNITSFSGWDSEYGEIELSEIGSTTVDTIDENSIVTQTEAMSETIDKFITSFTNYAVNSGLIDESNRSMFEGLLRDSMEEELSSSLII